MNIGEAIAQARREKGLSQAAAAKLIGCDRATLALWEVNRKLPQAKNLEKLKQVLELPASVVSAITVMRYTHRGPQTVGDTIQDTIAQVTREGAAKGLRLLFTDTDNVVELCKAITALQDLSPGTPEAVDTLAKAFRSATLIFTAATTAQIERGEAEGD